MAKPKPPHGGDGGDGGDTPPHRRPGGDGSANVENIGAAQETTARVAQQGRPPGAGGENRQPGQPNPANTDSRTFVDGITGDPKSVAGMSAQDIAQQFNDAGFPATVEQSTKKGTSGNAIQVRVQGHPEITNIQVHPGGGRHTPDGSPYWKISTSTGGKTWVIPDDFRGATDLRGNVIRYEE
jgi:hypothetical protein